MCMHFIKIVDVYELKKTFIMQRFVYFIYTVQSAKRLYPSRLRTWNFASHVTFLRGFCVEVAWVLRGISEKVARVLRNFAKFFSSSVEIKCETAQS